MKKTGRPKLPGKWIQFSVLVEESDLAEIEALRVAMQSDSERIVFRADALRRIIRFYRTHKKCLPTHSS